MLRTNAYVFFLNSNLNHLIDYVIQFVLVKLLPLTLMGYGIVHDGSSSGMKIS